MLTPNILWGIIFVVVATFVLCNALTITEGEYGALEALYNANDGENWAWKSRPVSLRGQLFYSTKINELFHIRTQYNIILNLNVARVWNFSNYDDPCVEDTNGRVWQGLICRCEAEVCTVAELDLQAYSLVGRIPSAFGNLINLEMLNFNSNSLSGPLTALTSLTALIQLRLEFNSFTDIPSGVGQLQQLTFFDLSSNPTATGQIPTEIGQMSSLEILDLAGCSMTGSLVSSIGSLSRLLNFYGGGNQLTGTLPDSLSNLSNLKYFIMDGNGLSGTIPSSYGDLLAVEQFLFSGNQLSGHIPPELGKLTKLDLLDLKYNRLSGAIPSELGSLVALKEMRMQVCIAIYRYIGCMLICCMLICCMLIC
jgi:Leucine-rich repeat (LRR) protein